MTILLTGATGFIGRHVLTLLIGQGHRVIAFARHAVVGEVPVDSERLVTIIGDVATGEGFDEIPWAELDAVVHLAASGVKASHRVWADAVAVNVVGTQRVLTAVKQKASRSPTVFLARTFYEHLTAQSPSLLGNPYIATKQAASELAILWAKDYPGRSILGTFFQVYGPGDDSGNVLSYAARELKAGRLATFGSGRGLRDWIYITDAASAVAASLNSISVGLVEIDIGSGILKSIRSVIEQMAHDTGHSDNELKFDPERDRADVGLTLAATEQPINWSPAVEMRNGLRFLYAKQ